MAVLARTHSPRHPRRITAGVILGTVLFLMSGMSGVARATTPSPTPATVPGLSTTFYGGISIFYASQAGQLIHRPGTTSGYGSAENLGGRLTSGPAAITIGSEFADTWAFVRGRDNGVWYRVFSDGKGEWSAWSSAGGRTFGAPGTTCVGDFTAQPIVYVRGTDNALWRRAPNGTWRRLGGLFSTDPGALPAVAGACPSREDIFMAGFGEDLWEHTAGSFHPVPGRTAFAPAAVQLPNGETDLFVRGLSPDRALWMNVRPSPGADWSGWRRVGGILTSAPVATIFPTSPATRVVLALGADGDVWRGSNVVGTTTWTWREVP